MVPETFETDRGLRYKCLECGKFMKPLPLEDVEEGPLEGAKDPREGARRMLIEDKHTIEEIMSETGLTRPVVTGLKGALAKKRALLKGPQEGEEEKEPLLPDGIELTRRKVGSLKGADLVSRSRQSTLTEF